jgi:hypothetical protein
VTPVRKKYSKSISVAIEDAFGGRRGIPFVDI